MFQNNWLKTFLCRLFFVYLQSNQARVLTFNLNIMPITYLDNKAFFNGMQIDDVELDGIDTRDYPDFCDAYINNMWLVDGSEVREATEAEIDDINDNERDYVYEQVWADLF